ncbi:MAG TPA: GDSL-type esterase/lipase family protein [Polyangiaceae bacterium]|nr:GDSL-type esterase/lipase family protein [Polyangiaceae bacterium]
MKTIAARTRSLASLAPLLLALGCGADDAAPNDSTGGAASGGADQGGSSAAAGTPSQVGGQTNSAGQASSAGQAGMSLGGGGASSASGGVAGNAPTSGSSSGGRSSSGGSGGSGNNAGSTSGGTSSGGMSSTGPIKVWLAGDSTVQECSGTCPCGWGSRFDPLFNDQVTVVNRAVGGRSIQTWLYEASVTSTLGGDGECTLSSQTYDKRWRDMLDASSGMKPGDYLFIQFGINDGDKACPRHVGLEAFKKYLGVMAQAAKEHGAQAVFVTPTSAIACSGNKATATRGAFVDATKAAAMASGVPVIDLHQLSIALYDSLGFCPNNDDYTTGELGAFFCEDHTHFEAAGAVKIAGLVGQALEDQGLSLASYLK